VSVTFATRRLRCYFGTERNVTKRYDWGLRLLQPILSASEFGQSPPSAAIFRKLRRPNPSFGRNVLSQSISIGPIPFWHLNEVDEHILLAELHFLREAVRKFLMETLLQFY
jgi:hypothetical protein